MDQREFEEQFGSTGNTIERDLIWSLLTARRVLETFRREYAIGEHNLPASQRDLYAEFKTQEISAKMALIGLWKAWRTNWVTIED
jgi:hypothetical protein